VVAVVVTARLIALIGESFANMTDYRTFFLIAGRLAWHGANPYHLIGGAAFFRTPFLEAPAFLMAFWPWTLLPEDLGRAAWIGLEILAVVGTLVAVYRGLGRPTPAEALVAASLVVLFPPLRDSFHEGQAGVFIGLAMALTLLAHQRGRPWLGGVALGAAIAVKLTPVLLLAYFTMTNIYRPVSEREVEGKYADIILEKDFRVQDSPYEWLLELKYVKIGERSNLEERVEAAKQEGVEQLRQYAQSRELAGMPGLKAVVLVLIGRNEVVAVECL